MFLFAAGQNDTFARGLIVKSDKIGSADFRLVGAEGFGGDEGTCTPVLTWLKKSFYILSLIELVSKVLFKKANQPFT